MARLAYAGMAVRCKGRSSSGAVDRQSGAREEAAAIHLMFCFVGAAGCSGVQRGAAGCSIGAAGVQRGVASKMSTAYLRRAFYSLWMAGWPSAAGWLSGAAMGSGVAMDKVHCMQFAWACVGVSRALVPISLFRSDPVAAACCVVVVPARPVL